MAQTGSTQAPPIDVQQLSTEANTAATAIKNSFQRGLVLDRIGAAVASTGDLESAAEIAKRAYPNDVTTLTAIGQQLAIPLRQVVPRFHSPSVAREIVSVTSHVADRLSQ